MTEQQIEDLQNFIISEGYAHDKLVSNIMNIDTKRLVLDYGKKCVGKYYKLYNKSMHSVSYFYIKKYVSSTTIPKTYSFILKQFTLNYSSLGFYHSINDNVHKIIYINMYEDYLEISEAEYNSALELIQKNNIESIYNKLVDGCN